MPLPVFPTLPVDVSVEYRDAIYEHPSLLVRFENGWEEARARTAAGKFKEFTVIYRVSSVADYATITGFLQDRKLQVEPFTFTHPYYGTGTVRYVGEELPSKILVQGSPAWFEIELKLRGLF